MIRKFIQQHKETRLAEVFKIMESALNILAQSRTFPEVDESSYQTLFRKNRIRSKYFTLLTGDLQKPPTLFHQELPDLEKLPISV